MELRKKLINTVAIPTLLVFSSCGSKSEIDTLFHNVTVNNQKRFSYNGEIFQAVVTSPTNNAWITLYGNSGTEVTIHNTHISINPITSNNVGIDPLDLITNLKPLDESK